jgi:hypothetical protein
MTLPKEKFQTITTDRLIYIRFKDYKQKQHSEKNNNTNLTLE